MKVEYEATFKINSKEDVRTKLNSAGANLARAEYMQRRAAFNLPKGHEIENGWLRVRDESDKVTLSLKVAHNNTVIENQKEIELTVSDYAEAINLLETIGCNKKAFQETKRELWTLDGVAITIDEWPFLEPFVEIEGESEERVKTVSEKLEFDFSTAYFGSVDGLYAEKYAITEDRINNHTPEILFDMQNPFID